MHYCYRYTARTVIKKKKNWEYIFENKITIMKKYNILSPALSSYAIGTFIYIKRKKIIYVYQIFFRRSYRYEFIQYFIQSDRKIMSILSIILIDYIDCCKFMIETVNKKNIYCNVGINNY